MPLGTVIVIISGQNSFSVLITRYRLCSSLPGSVSSFLNMMLFHIRAIFTPSRYHLPALITVIITVVSRLLLEIDSRLTFLGELSAVTGDPVRKVDPLFGFCSSRINFFLRLIFSPPTRTL